MKNEILAALFVCAVLAGTTPIFATNHTNAKALNETQLAKLNETQTKLTALIGNINGLLTTYKNTKNKGLLMALVQYKKQAKFLNAEINQLIKHPGWNVDKKINMLVKKEAQLEKKVNNTSNILNKTQNKTNILKNKTLNKTNCTIHIFNSTNQ